MTDDVETKLSAARTRLILDKPFLGALVLRLPMVAGDPQWCKTTATDARAFYYNRQYIDSLSLAQTQFVLAHEALHCALSHFARRQHRLKHRWDLACDFAVNPLLINDGLTPTPDALYLEHFDGMTAEEIYPNLDDNMDDEPQDQHLYDEQNESDSDRRQGQSPGDGGDQPKPEGEGSGREGEIDRDAGGGRSRSPASRDTNPSLDVASQPPPLSETDRQNLAVQWQQRLAGAAQQALQAGKMGAAMARMVDHLLQPQLPWRMLLARYVTAIARDDYSYMRPSRREGDAIFPSLRSSQVDLAIVLDTSGSLDDEEIAQFLGEINAIKGQLRARITVHACDAELSADGPWTFEAWEEIRLPAELHGGGGTSFVPAFAWAERLDRQPDLFLYFTDAEGEFPKAEPCYPVLWLVKGKAQVPFGQRVQLN